MERRCSAITLGLTPLPPISSRCPSAIDMWDYFTPPAPAIQVIEATPKTSPCPSERSSSKLHESVGQQRRRRKPQKSLSEQDSFDLIAVYPDNHRAQQPASVTQPHYYDEFEEDEFAETAALAQQISKLSRDNRCLDDSIITSTVNNTLKTSLLLNNRRAPLASLSSLKISSIECQDSELQSVDSDVVFGIEHGDAVDVAVEAAMGDEGLCTADTDDDMEQFSTDSDAVSDNGVHRLQRQSRPLVQRSSTIVCADIELKPRELPQTTDTSTMDRPKSIGTKLQSKSNKDCMLTQSLAAMALKKSVDVKPMPAHGNETILQPIVLSSHKRPASFAGIVGINDDGTNSYSSISQSNDSVNNNHNTENSNSISRSNIQKTNQLLLLSSGSNNTRCSKSTGNMADELLYQRPHHQSHDEQHPLTSISLSPSSPATIQAAQPLYPHSCYQIDDIVDDGNNGTMPNQCPRVAQHIQSADDRTVDGSSNNSSTSNCRQRQSSSIVNPSVILELPVIVSSSHDASSVTETDGTSSFDPSIPGPSRKWSKETLF